MMTIVTGRKNSIGPALVAMPLRISVFGIFPFRDRIIPAGTERRPNQSWTNIMSVQGWTNPEPILNQSDGLIRSATVQLWFAYVHTHPFTFWFSRTDPESKMPAGLWLKVNPLLYKITMLILYNTEACAHEDFRAISNALWRKFLAGKLVSEQTLTILC